MRNHRIFARNMKMQAGTFNKLVIDNPRTNLQRVDAHLRVSEAANLSKVQHDIR